MAVGGLRKCERMNAIYDWICSHCVHPIQMGEVYCSYYMYGLYGNILVDRCGNCILWQHACKHFFFVFEEPKKSLFIEP